MPLKKVKGDYFLIDNWIEQLGTVKPVLRGHLWGKEKVVFKNRWPLKRGSIHMKFSMTGHEKVSFKYRWLLNRSDHMGRFVCIVFTIYSAPSVYRPPFYRQTRLSPKFSSVPISPITNTPLYCQTQLPPSATAFQTQKS
jgi:hypothetical protein